MYRLRILLMWVMLLVGISAFPQYNPTNPDEPGDDGTEKKTYYALTLQCSPQDAGSFNIAAVTKYTAGTRVNLAAYTNTGYRFLRWELNGKELSTSSSLIYTIPNTNTTLVAVYEKYYNPDNPGEPQTPYIPRYATLNVKVNNTEGGYINIADGNRYEIGSSVRLQAYAYKDYKFVNWTQNGEVISTTPAFNYVVKESNPAITANFKYDNSYVYNPNNPGDPDSQATQPTKRKVTLCANPTGGGYFNIASGNYYAAGTNVTLRAYANKDYAFRYWAKGETVISTSYSFNYVVPDEDSELTAHYEYTWKYNPNDPGDPNSPNDQDVSIYGMTEKIFPGQTLNFPIYLRNNKAVYGALIDLVIPEGFTADFSNIVLSARCNGHELTVDNLNSGAVRLSLRGDSPFASDNGKIIEIPLTATTGIDVGTKHPVMILRGVAILANSEVLPLFTRDGILQVENPSDGFVYAKFSYDKFLNRVKFTDQSSSDIVSYEWDFGDGTNSTEKNPLHTYPQPGTYTVKLTVSNSLKTATHTQSVLVNDKSSWEAAGNFYLSTDATGLRNYSTYQALAQMLIETPITGNIIINVESGKEFNVNLDDTGYNTLSQLYNKLKNGGRTLGYAKSGKQANPTLNFGTSNIAEFNSKHLEIFRRFGDIQTCNGVEIKFFGVNFDVAKLNGIGKQELCSRNRSNPVSFASISTDMQFDWKIAENPSGVRDYIESGSGTIPSMTIINEGLGDANLIYNVTASYKNSAVAEFQVEYTVHPSLVGLFNSLSPRNDEHIEGTNINLSWNLINNARYDVYLWNVNEPEPDKPIVESSMNLRTSIANFIRNGNSYKWYVRAHNNCNELCSEVQTFHIGALPDLHVSKIDLGDAVAGKELDISWTVVNDGNGGTGSTGWTDYIWLVPDVFVGTQYAYLDQSKIHPKLLKSVANLKALEAGESYTNSAKIKLDERTSGNLWIIVTADMYSVENIDWSAVKNIIPDPYTPSASGSPYNYLQGTTRSDFNKLTEANETPTKSDNFNYKKINIAVPGLVDLATRQVTATVNNQPGTVNIQGRRERVIPTPHTTCGLAESTEFYSGKFYKVKAVIENIGEKKMERTKFTSVLFVSDTPDGNITGRLASVCSKDTATFLEPKGKLELEFDCQLPYDWHGDTYFYVLADANKAVTELASTDNNWGVSEKYDVKLTPAADFVPQELKTPSKIVLGEPFEITYNVKNAGPNIPTTSSNWTDNIYISKKAEFDESAVLIDKHTQGLVYQNTIIGDNAPGPVLIPASYFVPKGDNYTAQKKLTVNSLEEGNYYLFVKVDAENKVFEPNGEENNIICSDVISCKLPDLEILNPKIESETVLPDKQVALSWVIKNSGHEIVKNRTVENKIFVSRNQDGAKPTEIKTVSSELFINPGEEQTVHANISIPNRAEFNGVLYLFVNCNHNKTLKELEYSNNQTTPVKITFQYQEPGKEPDKPDNPQKKETDISISNISIPESYLPDEVITVSYTLYNKGNKMVTKELSNEVFISEKSTLDNSAIKCQIVSTKGTTVNLSAEDSTPFILTVKVPGNMMGGTKYLHVAVDRANTLGETNIKNNVDYGAIQLKGNLPDIKVMNMVCPDTVTPHQNFEVSWNLTNAGTWSAPPFKVQVYRQTTTGNEVLATLALKGLAASESTQQKATLSFPDRDAGKWIISINPELECKQLTVDDKFATRPVVVKQGPLADLTVTSLQIDGVARSGQQVTLTTEFKNIGEYVTRQPRWSEDYYLANSNIFNPQTAIKIGSRGHFGALDAGESYKSAITVTIPPSAEGNYMIFAIVDGADAVYESNENNNSRSIPVSIPAKMETETDLTVANISAPAQIYAGQQFSLSYEVANIGTSTAKGTCRDVIYLSTDDKWDLNDQMVGTVTSEVEINPGCSDQRTVTGRLYSVPEGTYYLIIKTNSTRSIVEKDAQNNYTTLKSPVSVKFNTLNLNDTKRFNTSGYFKLNIPAGSENKTIGFYLNQDAANTTGLYVSYEKVPTTASYMECSTKTRTDLQEVIIPNVKQGNYYILAQDNSAVVSTESMAFSLTSAGEEKKIPLSLSCKELTFGASSLSLKEGGNGGWLSTTIKGAMLEPIMDFRLVNKNEVIPVEVMNFKSTTSTNVSFNLNNAQTGVYDLVSELPDGTTATLKSGFTVVPATSGGIEVVLDGPEQARFDSYAPMSLTYANNGSNDVALLGFLIKIDAGYISTTYEGLNRDKQKELFIKPNYDTDRRGYISLPPGEKHTQTFFIKTGSSSENNVIAVYIVK